jgi:NitT/TauT family transport system permease protein
MQRLHRQARRLRHRLWQSVCHLACRVRLPAQLHPVPTAGTRDRQGRELAQDGALWENASISLQRIALGFFFGALIGIPLGLAIGSFGLVRRILEPYTEFLRFIPATALITVAVIWFGIGKGSTIFLIISTTVFIVIINSGGPQ